MTTEARSVTLVTGATAPSNPPSARSVTLVTGYTVASNPPQARSVTLVVGYDEYGAAPAGESDAPLSTGRRRRNRALAL